MPTTDVAFAKDAVNSYGSTRQIDPAGRSKNGSTIAGCQPTGFFSLYDERAFPGPTDDEVETKYTNRFDEPSYYFGNSGAGTYTGSGS